MIARKSKEHPRRVILVMGMHRSGTSALARVVNLLGAELGGALIPPGFDNPKGFWELAAAVKINDDLLHGLGRTWYDMREMPANWVKSSAAQEALAKIQDIITGNFADRSFYVLKDPRFCLTAQLWVKAFVMAGFEVSCLFIVRDPNFVVDSLHRRNDWPREALFLMWTQYLLAAVSATQQCQRTLVTYEGLLANWRGTMSKVAQDLGFVWPVDFDVASGEIGEFLDTDHATPRGAGATSSSDSHRALPNFVSDLYNSCLAIAERQGDWSAITRLEDSFKGAADVYAARVDNLLNERWAAEAKTQKAEGQQAETHGMASSIAALEAEARNWDAKLGGLDSGVAGLSSRFDQVLTWIADMKERDGHTRVDDTRIQSIEQGLGDLAKELSVADSRLSERIDGIRSWTDQGQREADRRLGQSEEQARGHASALSALQSRAAKIEELQCEVRERQGHVEQRIGEHALALSALELRWQRRVDRQERLLQTLHRRIEQLEPMLTGKIDEGYAELCRRSDALEQRLQHVQREQGKQLLDVQQELSVRSAQADATVLRLTERIHALTSSTSWKLTAPLRWFKMKLWPHARN